jgi:hypothetical protein
MLAEIERVRRWKSLHESRIMGLEHLLKRAWRDAEAGREAIVSLASERAANASLTAECEAAEQREAGLVGCPLTETLTWHPADEPPDADLLVLLGFRGDGWEAGYWDSEHWRNDENAVVTLVTHWAHPEGPL